MIKTKYEFIDHTADLGIKVWGKDLPLLFSNAAYALFDIITDLNKVEEKEEKDIEVKSENLTELFVEWLRELLYRFEVDEMIFKKFDIHTLTEQKLSSHCFGEKIDRKRHKLKSEIKTVTYHQLYIKKVKDVWEVQVIFDI